MKTTNDQNALEAKITELETENNALKAENAGLKVLVKHYEELYRLNRHRLWGRSSERADQISIFNEAEVTAGKKAPEPEFEEVVVRKVKKRIGKREELYEGLPTEQVVHELPESERICPECGGELHACGHDVLRREIEIIPAQVKAVEHVQTVYSCRNCEKNAADNPVPMFKSEVPAPVIPKSGIASPSLVAYIISAKFVLSLPLDRQEKEFERLGIEIPKQNMANWVIYVAERWLKYIYTLFVQMLVMADILHADETTLQVIREDGRDAKQLSYMWLYRTFAGESRPIVLFEYQPTRSSSHPLRFLNDYKGYLHTDGYEGYKKLEAQGVTVVECWAHVRRKFLDVIKSLDKADRPNHPASVGFDFCNILFLLEEQYDLEKLTSEQRLERRLAESRPFAIRFFLWAAEQAALPTTLPKSTYGTAVGYAVNQQSWLQNIYKDGRLVISNNLAESSIRPFAVGRKNWLFSYSAKGAEASAIAYSIVETAKANGLVPFEYLRLLFERLPNLPKERYAECLPWADNVKARCVLK